MGDFVRVGRSRLCFEMDLAAGIWPAPFDVARGDDGEEERGVGEFVLDAFGEVIADLELGIHPDDSGAARLKT